MVMTAADSSRVPAADLQKAGMSPARIHIEVFAFR
jgi:hypothetical protein